MARRKDTDWLRMLYHTYEKCLDENEGILSQSQKK